MAAWRGCLSMGWSGVQCDWVWWWWWEGPEEALKMWPVSLVGHLDCLWGQAMESAWRWVSRGILG